MGYTTPAQYKQFLLDCLKWLPNKTNLCIILWATFPLPQFKSTADSHLAINNIVKELAKDEPRLHYIEVDDFVKGKNDITDHINHYQTRVYYEIAQAMIRVISEVTGSNLGSLNQFYIAIDKVVKMLKPRIKEVLVNHQKIYTFFQRIYFKIARRNTNIK